MDTKSKLEPESGNDKKLQLVDISVENSMKRTCCSLSRLQGSAWKDNPVPCTHCISQKTDKWAFVSCQTGEETRTHFLSCRAREANDGKLSAVDIVWFWWERLGCASSLRAQFCSLPGGSFFLRLQAWRTALLPAVPHRCSDRSQNRILRPRQPYPQDPVETQFLNCTTRSFIRSFTSVPVRDHIQHMTKCMSYSYTMLYPRDGDIWIPVRNPCTCIFTV